MPARKPNGLNRRHETKADKTKRESQEGAMRSERKLSGAAPARLTGHKVASEVWRRLMREYNQLEAVIVTRIDVDLLIDYCMLMEQVVELDTMRHTAYALWLELGAKHDASEPDEAAEVAMSVVDAFDAVIKLDGRVDRKRALLLQLRQSLYLTPRARAGAVPKTKTPEPEKDPLEDLLDEVDMSALDGK